MSQEMKQPSGPNYWKSLDEKADSPEFQEWLNREFPEGASEYNGVNRRQFLKVMAASFSLAGVGMAGCRRPRKHVLPYSKQPENVAQGLPSFYTTSMPRTWGNIPLIVESHQGRPTKIEGNPSYERYAGATDTFSQASVLGLYDPDRIKQSRKDGAKLSRPELLDLLKEISGKMQSSSGEGIAFLSQPGYSPSKSSLVKALLEKYPNLTWAEYESVENNAFEKATEKVLGKKIRAFYHLDKAKRVLTLDADFAGLQPDSIGNNASFANARRVRSTKDAKQMSRLYSVESDLTLTGSTADHRLRLNPSEIEQFVLLVAEVVFEKLGKSLPLAGEIHAATQAVHKYHDWAEACAEDLVHEKGHSVVIVGNDLSATAQLVGMLINQALGAEGHTVDYLELEPSSANSCIVDLTKKIKSGSIKTLILLGGNPAYDAPGDLDFAMFLKTVPEVLRYGLYEDESADCASIQVAASHYLESWGDGYTFEGKYVPVQPLIEPLYDTIGELEFLSRLGGFEVTDDYTIFKKTAEGLFPDFAGPLALNKLLSEGVVVESGYEIAKADAASGFDALQPEIAGVASSSSAGIDALEVKLTSSYHTYDGSFANNGWTMECPDPLTKLTWDNAILISPALAKELESTTDIQLFATPSLLNNLGELQRNSSIFKRGKEEAPVGKLEVNGNIVEGPVHVLPGLADFTVVISKGFGRTTGRIASGTGFDVFGITQSSEGAFLKGAKLTLTGDTFPLANTQEHWSLEGRAIIREGTTKDYAKHPDFVSKMGMESHSPAVYGNDADKSAAFKAVKTPRGGSMYDTPNFEVKDRFNPDDPDATWAPQQWGMTIDLNTCTGCNACVVACQSENNIPIVGKDQVRRGREMHWIRLDRYFSSADNTKTDIPSDVQVSFQGMSCVHCELAPCETVCPVNATVHDKQGLNVMAYNRCVGTRYCANNCPYKVRRFNFFDWNKREIGKYYQGPLGPVDEPQVEQMQRNPDVTVRMRGVMEKCTYCVQRIQNAKILQKSIAKDSSNIEVPDGKIKTACQQVCPAQAIEFGDVTDPNSAVSKAKESDLNYSVLGYLNTRPRTTYLAKLRNPNPEMPEKYRYKLPYTRAEYDKKSHSGGDHGDHGAASAHAKDTHHEPKEAEAHNDHH